MAAVLVLAVDVCAFISKLVVDCVVVSGRYRDAPVASIVLVHDELTVLLEQFTVWRVLDAMPSPNCQMTKFMRDSLANAMFRVHNFCRQNHAKRLDLVDARVCRASGCFA